MRASACAGLVLRELRMMHREGAPRCLGAGMVHNVPRDAGAVAARRPLEPSCAPPTSLASPAPLPPPLTSSRRRQGAVCGAEPHPHPSLPRQRGAVAGLGAVHAAGGAAAAGRRWLSAPARWLARPAALGSIITSDCSPHWIQYAIYIAQRVVPLQSIGTSRPGGSQSDACRRRQVAPAAGGGARGMRGPAGRPGSSSSQYCAPYWSLLTEL